MAMFLGGLLTIASFTYLVNFWVLMSLIQR